MRPHQSPDPRWPDDGSWHRSALDPEENTVTDPTPVEPTPEPVIKAAATWGSLAALILTAVGVLVALGVLSSEQGAAVTDVVNYVTANIVTAGTALVGLFTLVSSLITAHVVAFTARRHVTPVRRRTVEGVIR